MARTSHMREHGLAMVPAMALVLAVGIAVMNGGCGGSDEGKVGGEIQEGGTFYYSLNAEPVSLDPAMMRYSESIQVGKQIYDGLMENDPETMELAPALADSYEVNADATVFTFKLKEGMEFHNGRECTAEDFVYSWNRLVDPATGSEVADHLSPVKGFNEFRAGTAPSLEGVEAVDDHTLRVTLAYPYADFVYRTAHPALSPIPKEVVEEFGSENFSENPVGTGPFEFVEWRHEQQITIGKFEDYYGEPAHLDSVVFRIYTDENAAFQDFKEGILDDCQIPPGQFEAVAADYGDHALMVPALGTYGIVYNQDMGPWKDNKALRQALNYAVDRERLAWAVMEDQRLAAGCIVPPGVPGYLGNVYGYSYDVARAEGLLAEAGYPNGQGLPEISLAYDTGGGYELPIQYIEEDFEAIGVNVKPEGYEWNTYQDLIRAGQLAFFRSRWLAGYLIMDSFLYPNFNSLSTGNYGRYNNPEVDSLLERARATPYEAERLELYQQAERIVLEDAAVIPLVYYKTSRVYGDDIGGYFRTVEDFTPMERVYFLAP